MLFSPLPSFPPSFSYLPLLLPPSLHSAWLEYHDSEKKEKVAFLLRMSRAKVHYTTRMNKKIFTRWRVSTITSLVLRPSRG